MFLIDRGIVIIADQNREREKGRRKICLPYYPDAGLKPPDPANVRRAGLPCGTLKRVRIMNIHLGKLNTGDFRRATPKELEELEWQLEQARLEREEAELLAGQDE